MNVRLHELDAGKHEQIPVALSVAGRNAHVMPRAHELGGEMPADETRAAEDADGA